MSDGEQLGRLETTVGRLVADVGDHETRIRVNEKLGYKVAALSAAGAFLGSAVAMFLAFLSTQ